MDNLKSKDTYVTMQQLREILTDDGKRQDIVIIAYSDATYGVKIGKGNRKIHKITAARARELIGESID